MKSYECPNCPMVFHTFSQLSACPKCGAKLVQIKTNTDHFVGVARNKNTDDHVSIIDLNSHNNERQ